MKLEVTSVKITSNVDDESPSDKQAIRTNPRSRPWNSVPRPLMMAIKEPQGLMETY